MSVSTRINLDHAAIAKYLKATGVPSVERAAKKTVERTQANIISSGRVKTGAMLRSVAYKVVPGKEPTADISVAVPYAKYQEVGTSTITGAFFLTRAYDSLTIRDFLP